MIFLYKLLKNNSFFFMNEQFYWMNYFIERSLTEKTNEIDWKWTNILRINKVNFWNVKKRMKTMNERSWNYVALVRQSSKQRGVICNKVLNEVTRCAHVDWGKLSNLTQFKHLMLILSNWTKVFQIIKVSFRNFPTPEWVLFLICQVLQLVRP